MTSKGTPRRTIRIANDIWNPADDRAKSEGTSLAERIRQFVTEYGQAQKEQTK